MLEIAARVFRAIEPESGRAEQRNPLSFHFPNIPRCSRPVLLDVYTLRQLVGQLAAKLRVVGVQQRGDVWLGGHRKESYLPGAAVKLPPRMLGQSPESRHCTQSCDLGWHEKLVGQCSPLSSDASHWRQTPVDESHEKPLTLQSLSEPHRPWSVAQHEPWLHVESPLSA